MDRQGKTGLADELKTNEDGKPTLISPPHPQHHKRFVRGLDLKLSTRETFQFFAIADRDNDERIVWSEVPSGARYVACVWNGPRTNIT